MVALSAGILTTTSHLEEPANTGARYPGEYEIDDQPLECETCHADVSLWQCLICGKVGCGRYEGKHAYAHFQESGHSFSMDLDSMRVWDYAGDSYVHRIIQDASRPGEKLVELPGRRKEPTALEGQEDTDMLKMENVALEYTHLLTSQLESQRVYFEEIVERAVDKATEASKRAEQASAQSSAVTEKLTILEREHDFVAKGKVPELEKEKNRHEIRAKRLEEMAKNVNQKYLEEKSSAHGLMERLKHLEGTEIASLKQKIKSLEEDNATKELLMEGLREEHRDAMIQVSAEKQLREMVQRGELDPEELEGATITAGKRPLTARERLRERLDTEKAVRAGKKNMLGKQAEGKKPPDDKPSTSEDETSNELPGTNESGQSVKVTENGLVAHTSEQGNLKGAKVVDASFTKFAQDTLAPAHEEPSKKSKGKGHAKR